MPPVTFTYYALPAPSTVSLPLLLDDTLEARCHIVVRVLACRMPAATEWVRWSPTSPFASQLQVLGLLAGIEPLWELLLQRGWIQHCYTSDTLAFRLTESGWRIARAPSPPLPLAPHWLRAILAHLG